MEVMGEPYSLEAEISVIGGLLIEYSDAFEKVYPGLKPEHFYHPRHRIIYRAILELSLENKPVDLVTITEHLRKRGELEDAGGAAYLASLCEQVVSAANIETHARIIIEKATLRELIRTSSQIIEMAREEREEVDRILDRAESMILKVRENIGTRRVVPLQDPLKEVIRIIEARSERESPIVGIPSGFPKLDDLTTGFHEGEYVVIAGRPSVGKSAFALTLAYNMSHRFGYPVLFFSLEMTSQQLVQRLLSMVGKINSKRLRSGRLSEEEWSRLTTAAGILRDVPIYLDDTPGIPILELKGKVRRFVRDKGVKVVMIDYLQLIKGPPAENRQQEVAGISRALRAIANDHKIVVIALSQLSRAPKGQEKKRPILSDLRESGAIEQDADMVIFIHREEMGSREARTTFMSSVTLIVAKNRHGPQDDVPVLFHPQYVLFTPPEREEFE